MNPELKDIRLCPLCSKPYDVDSDAAGVASKYICRKCEKKAEREGRLRIAH